MDGTVCADRLFCGSALSGGADGANASIEHAKNSNKESGTEQCAPGPSRQAWPIRPVTKVLLNLHRPPGAKAAREAFSRLNFNPLTF